MLLRNSISNTKKFLQKTIDNFKSLLSKRSTYQRLPKTPPLHNLFSCGRDSDEMDANAGYHTELDHFYSEFTNQWDSHKRKVKKKDHCTYNGARIEEHFKNTGKDADYDKKEINNEDKGKVIKSNKILLNVSPRIMKNNDICSKSVREKRLCFVAEKLKEFEMIENGNVVNQNKRDYEEFLHCYSRISCPAYLDIVDKFFMEMCKEFSGSQASLQG
ncbi:uncharacterized protein LOC104902196 [Beta vulgaris subsp. vulgaris]|uniref:uncharacterized protein LOC104902196 n=1 Tax=Beta vulgaris subsp. vulgaris TaxID=3555 RepID=UPI002036699A|nr:uncharacterized protein LOC104902196 [Beta vulgaris subsp. vulgaris]